MHARTARMTAYTARLAARLEQLGLSEDPLVCEALDSLREDHQALWDENWGPREFIKSSMPTLGGLRVLQGGKAS